ncbi:MAG: hypothetical protein VYC34_00955, partial [Planctomycetota bacterium]|nr:hypothetical protein [Planctomycetota bacterium]
ALGEDRQFDPGNWRAPWSEQSQADWLAALANITLSRPLIASFCWSELYDGSRISDIAHGGLITREGRAKLALRRMADIRRRIRARQSISDLQPA